MLLLMPHGVIISLPASHQYFLPMQPRIALSTLATWLDWEPISSQLSSVKPFLGCCLLKYNPKSYHWYLHKNIPAYTVPSAAIQPHVKRRIIQGSPDCCAIRYLWRAALYHLPPCFLQPGPLGCIRTRLWVMLMRTGPWVGTSWDPSEHAPLGDWFLRYNYFLRSVH